MTDLCDAADAEAACERAVEQALAAGAPERAPLPEALQTCANLRISQCRPADAASSLLKVVEHIAAAVDGGELEALPSHEFRTTTAKLLLEVGEVEPACDVLEQLLLEVRLAPMARVSPPTFCQSLSGAPASVRKAVSALSRAGLRTARTPRARRTRTSPSCAISRRSRPRARATARAPPATSSGFSGS